MGVYLYDWSYEELKSIFDKAEETQIGAFTEVKTPHGRLIDAEVIKDSFMEKVQEERLVFDDERYFPTVIEAEVE